MIRLQAADKEEGEGLLSRDRASPLPVLQLELQRQEEKLALLEDKIEREEMDKSKDVLPHNCLYEAPSNATAPTPVASKCHSH